MFQVKSFNELTTIELYEILRTRAEIFVVEQECVYQDLDTRDYDSLHVFAQDENGRVTAYLRIYPRTDEPGVWQIGRVLTLKHGTGLGGLLLQEGICAAVERFGASELYLEAQTYAIGFYEKCQFRVTSSEFLEDGIPHVEMRRSFAYLL